MDIPVGSASTAPPKKTKRGMRVGKVIALLLLGFSLGAVISVISMWGKSNRVVIYNQPFGPYAIIRSVRIAKDGFLTLNIEQRRGLAVGGVYPLASGYYRNLVVPIDPDIIVEPDFEDNPIAFECMIRLFVDNGDGVLDEKTDVPVKDMFGRMYNKRFWMLYNKTSFIRVREAIRANPLQFVFDTLFP